MGKILLALTLLLSLLTVVAAAADLNGSCLIRFSGDSTLHGFNGVANCQPFAFNVLSGQGADLLIQEGAVQVAVTGMDTDNDSRDAKMFEMFEADQYPFILGHFPQFNLQQLIVEMQRGNDLAFEMTIRDTSNTIHAAIQDLTLVAGRLAFKAEFPVSLSSYDLKAPSVLGIIRVADEVQVTVDVILEGDVLTAP